MNKKSQIKTTMIYIFTYYTDTNSYAWKSNASERLQKTAISSAFYEKIN